MTRYKFDGQTYTGADEFVDTVMYLTVNHEVAPTDQAYGLDDNCSDCHFSGQVDRAELGWSADPLQGGNRP